MELQASHRDNLPRLKQGKRSLSGKTFLLLRHFVLDANCPPNKESTAAPHSDVAEAVSYALAVAEHRIYSATLIANQKPCATTVTSALVNRC